VCGCQDGEKDALKDFEPCNTSKSHSKILWFRPSPAFAIFSLDSQFGSSPLIRQSIPANPAGSIASLRGQLV
jgi:hypothetical protein